MSSSIYDNVPRIKQERERVDELIKNESIAFSQAEFIGESYGGLVKVYYCVSKKGFFKTDISNSMAADIEALCSAIPEAINNALHKFYDAYASSTKKINDLEEEFNRFFLDAVNAIVKEQSSDVPTTSPKKTYLN